MLKFIFFSFFELQNIGSLVLLVFVVLRNSIKTNLYLIHIWQIYVIPEINKKLILEFLINFDQCYRLPQYSFLFSKKGSRISNIWKILSIIRFRKTFCYIYLLNYMFITAICSIMFDSVNYNYVEKVRKLSSQFKIKDFWVS